MHIVRIDLDAPGISFKLTPPAGTRETVRMTTLEFLKQQDAQFAINVHFFEPYPSADRDVFLIGLAASDGNIYSDFEDPRQSYAIVSKAPALHISADNRVSVIRSAGGEKLHIALAGSAQIVTNGSKTIPFYRDADHPDGQLTPGGPGNYSNAKSWYETSNARTVIAVNKSELILFTVDRSGTSQGLTVSEVADLLIRDYHVTGALNLDGGGSTTLAMQDPATGVRRIVNAPSGGPEGRAVGSNLAIYARPIQTAP
jgi:exopolysaccharide biosynthesis protein